MLENLPYLESLYENFRRDENSVSAEWREIFSEKKISPVRENGNGSEKITLPPQSPTRGNARYFSLDEKLHMLVRNYRVRGHKIAAIDPLGAERPCPPELKLDYYNFSENELEQVVNLPTLNFNAPLTVREIFAGLQNTYARSIGAQFMHIDDLSVRRWLQKRMESTQNRLTISREQQLRILTRLTDATIFEEFLRKKFLGAKTFSLE